MGEAQRRWAAKQRAERDEIRQFKAEHPEAWAQMLRDVQAKEQARLAAEEQARREEAERNRIRRSVQDRLNTSLIVRELPAIPDIQRVRGRLALRQWNINNEGWLTSNGYRSDAWTTQMIADQVPTEKNTNGLYCIEISPEAFMSSRTGERVTDYCGIIELRGHLEYHEKEHGIRAEWARILGIFVLDESPDIYWRIPKLVEHYPGVPLFTTTRDYVAKYLMRLVMWQETGDEMILYNNRIR